MFFSQTYSDKPRPPCAEIGYIVHIRKRSRTKIKVITVVTHELLNSLIPLIREAFKNSEGLGARLLGGRGLSEYRWVKKKNPLTRVEMTQVCARVLPRNQQQRGSI